MRMYDSWWPSAYFLFIIIIGNYILLKLFIAILITSFDLNDEDEEEEGEEELDK